MATGREGAYEVAYKRVAVRDVPSLKGMIQAVLTQGTQVYGTPFEVDGQAWLRLSPYTLLPNINEEVGEEDSSWVLIDGNVAGMGLGTLMTRLIEEDPDTDPMAEAELEVGKVRIKIRKLSGELHEVAVDAFADLQDMKVAIETATGIPRREQRLIHGDSELTESRLQNLLAYNEGNLELTLVRRPPKQARWLVRVKRDWSSLRHADQEIRADREVVLRAVGQDWKALLHAADELRADRDVVTAAVRQGWEALEHVSWEMRSDPEVVLHAVRQSAGALVWASPTMLADPDVMYAAVKRDPEWLKQADKQMLAERRMVLTAVRQDGALLQLADPKLRADRKVVLTAVENSGDALQFAAQELREDRDVVLAAVRKDWHALKYAAVYQADPKVVLAAALQNPQALDYASTDILGNAEVILPAARSNPEALRYATRDLMESDREVAIAVGAAKHRPELLKRVTEELHSAREAVLAAVNTDGMLLRFAAEALAADREVVLAAVCQNGLALRYATEPFSGDRRLVLLAVEGDWRALEFASVELRGDRDIILAAAGQSTEALELATKKAATDFWADPKVWSDPDVVQDLVAQDGMLLKKAHMNVRAEPEVVLAAVRQNWEAVRFAQQEARADREVVRAAVTQDPQAFRHISGEFWSDREMMLAAVEAHGSALQFASTRLKADLKLVAIAVRQDREALKYASAELQKDHGAKILAEVEWLEQQELKERQRRQEPQQPVQEQQEELDTLKQEQARLPEEQPQAPQNPPQPLREQSQALQEQPQVPQGQPQKRKEQEQPQIAQGQPQKRKEQPVARQGQSQTPQEQAQQQPQRPQPQEQSLQLQEQAQQQPQQPQTQQQSLQLQAQRPLQHQGPGTAEVPEGVVAEVARAGPQDAAAAAGKAAMKQQSEPPRASLKASELTGPRSTAPAGARALDYGPAQKSNTRPQLEPAHVAHHRALMHLVEADDGSANDKKDAGKIATIPMTDPEGEQGLYTGPQDARGRAHGCGEFVYEDGERFIGEFSEGAMRRGVLYSKKTSRPRDTMEDGDWTPKVSRAIVDLFPIHKAAQAANRQVVEEARQKAAQEADEKDEKQRRRNLLQLSRPVASRLLTSQGPGDRPTGVPHLDRQAEASAPAKEKEQKLEVPSVGSNLNGLVPTSNGLVLKKLDTNPLDMPSAAGADGTGLRADRVAGGKAEKEQKLEAPSVGSSLGGLVPTSNGPALSKLSTNPLDMPSAAGADGTGLRADRVAGGQAVPSAVAAPEEESAKQEGLWRVTGGKDKGGIIVRKEKSTASAVLSSRLSTGASIRELEISGGRLHYEKVSGDGPEYGWVSMTNGKSALVERLSAKEGECRGPLQHSFLDSLDTT